MVVGYTLLIDDHVIVEWPSTIKKYTFTDFPMKYILGQSLTTWMFYTSAITLRASVLTTYFWGIIRPIWMIETVREEVARN